MGKHLLIDLQQCRYMTTVDDPAIIRVLFDVLIAYATMKAMPDSFKFTQFPSRVKGMKGGYSAFQILSESHISVHTCPENRTVNLDLFSCRDDWDCKAIIRTCKTFFGIVDDERDVRYQIISREC